MMNVLVTGGSGFIGSHLLEELGAAGHRLTNLDVRAPAPGSAWAETFRAGSLLDRNGLKTIFQEVRPTHVVHLAAVAKMDAKSLDEFSPNTQGVANLLEAVEASGSVVRLIVTSTQHVRKPGSGAPVNDVDYIPYKLYGESKVVTERLTRDASLTCAWTLIRPTAVWGPRQLLLADGLWRLIARGHYFHPSGDPVVRSYGYVRNLVWQVHRLLLAPLSAVDRKMFYIADGNIRQQDWVNAVARELTGRDVHTVPLPLVRALSACGDLLRWGGLSFPIFRDRLENLITPNPVPTEPILELLGPPPVSLVEGAKETAVWLRRYYEKGQP
jgi:GlcNAc-P-P-Und epimerase